VAKQDIFSKNEIKFLEELVKAKVDFMVVGLSAAALQGASAVTQDIDLWFRDLADPGIRKALRKVKGIYVPSFGINPPMFAGESVELFDIVINMHGLDSFENEVRQATSVKIGHAAVKVLPIERIILSKRSVGRDKDKAAIPMLKSALKIISRKQPPFIERH